MTTNAFFDLAANMTSPDSVLFSGTLQQGSAMNGPLGATFVSNLSDSTAFQSASWQGNGNTWGASLFDVAQILSGSYTGSLATGHWWGIDTSWATYQLLSESRDRTDVFSNLVTEIDQGIGPGDWNPFPIPLNPVAPELPPRDLTRYRKAYSFGRNQPVRIRLVR